MVAHPCPVGCDSAYLCVCVCVCACARVYVCFFFFFGEYFSKFRKISLLSPAGSSRLALRTTVLSSLVRELYVSFNVL